MSCDYIKEYYIKDYYVSADAITAAIARDSYMEWVKQNERGSQDSSSVAGSSSEPCYSGVSTTSSNMHHGMSNASESASSTMYHGVSSSAESASSTMYHGVSSSAESASSTMYQVIVAPKCLMFLDLYRILGSLVTRSTYFEVYLCYFNRETSRLKLSCFDDKILSKRPLLFQMTMRFSL